MPCPDLKFTEAFVRQLFDDRQADHAMRVAAQVDPEHKAAAWLHDIVEDTDVTLEDLKELGYDDETLRAVDLLTWPKKELTYSEYIDRICESGFRRAVLVKIADQNDNLDPKRMMTRNRYAQNALHKRYAGVLRRLKACL